MIITNRNRLKFFEYVLLYKIMVSKCFESFMIWNLEFAMNVSENPVKLLNSTSFNIHKK